MTRDSHKKPFEEGSDRRKRRRVPYIKFAWYRTVHDTSMGSEEDPDSLEGISRTCDISRTGIGIVVARPIAVGTLVFVEIATDQTNLSGIGKVMNSARIQSGMHRVGIHWLVVPPNDELLLGQMCEEDDQG